MSAAAVAVGGHEAAPAGWEAEAALPPDADLCGYDATRAEQHLATLRAELTPP